jgi:hypothetical protein
MPNTLVRTFHQIEQAQHARDALLGAGFSVDEVRLDVAEDEAGPVADNFVLDRTDTPPEGVDRNQAPQPEKNQNSQALTRGTCILSVASGDEDRLRRAADLLDRYGALDPQARDGRH